MLDVPIVFFVFNRPEHTKKSFEAIRKIAPNTLFIVADGPRVGNLDDLVKCQEVRALVGLVDWPCNVFTSFSEVNLGCRRRINSGLDWVFSNVPMAIILEDDCIPHDDFFLFCREMLLKYRDCNKVMCISGNNFIKSNVLEASYYFSKYPHIWGWATWGRAWKLNDQSMSFWPSWKSSNKWRTYFISSTERRYWQHYFDLMHKSKIDTWDYVWTANIWFHDGISITPNVNLVTNIGIGPDATHTYSETNIAGELACPILPLIHPEDIVINHKCDHISFNNVFNRERRFTVKFYVVELIKNIMLKLKKSTT